MFFRSLGTLFSPFVCSLVVLGCSSDASPPSAAPLSAWNGSWRAIETYMRSSAFDPVAEAIHAERPEYTAAGDQRSFLCRS